VEYLTDVKVIFYINYIKRDLKKYGSFSLFSFPQFQSNGIKQP